MGVKNIVVGLSLLCPSHAMANATLSCLNHFSALEQDITTRAKGTTGCPQAEIVLEYYQLHYDMFHQCIKPQNNLTKGGQKTNVGWAQKVKNQRREALAQRNAVCTKPAPPMIAPEADTNTTNEISDDMDNIVEDINACFSIDRQAPQTASTHKSQPMVNIGIIGDNQCQQPVYVDYIACNEDYVFSHGGGENLYQTSGGHAIAGTGSPYKYQQLGGFTLKKGVGYKFAYVASFDPIRNVAQCPN
ncbi:MAG: hypothetical protein ACPGVK_07195 [Halocynthiibacter sp.]